MKFNNLMSAVLFAGLFTMVSCSQEEQLGEQPQNNGKNFLQITVDDEGVRSSNPTSRAIEDGYKTTFEAGDEIGVYVVDMKTKKIYNPAPDDGGIDARNWKFTLKEDGTWDPNGYGIERIEEEMEQLKFFAYYPYQGGGIDFDVEVAAANEGGDPFAEAVKKWEIDYGKLDTEYTKSDLMTSKATDAVTSGALGVVNFKLNHRLSIAAIELPGKIYSFTNEEPKIDSYKLSATPEEFTVAGADNVKLVVKPYYDKKNNLYRILVRPNEEYTLAGTFTLEGRKEFTYTRTAAEAKEGKAVKLKLKGSIVKEHELQAGDYYCADGSIVGKNEIGENKAPENAIGVVYFAGNPQPSVLYKYTEFQDALRRDFPNCTHGLVIALKDAKSGATSKFSNNKGKDIDPWRNENFGESYIKTLSTSVVLDMLGYNHTKVMQLSQEAANYKDRSDIMCETLAAYEVSAPSTSTGWFCPSLGDFNTIIKNYETINASITAAKGELKQYPELLTAEWNKVKNAYWTSSVRNTDAQWVSGLNPEEEDGAKSALGGCNSSGNQQHFRFCLAF